MKPEWYRQVLLWSGILIFGIFAETGFTQVNTGQEAGDLDNGFGSDGIVILPIPDDSLSDEANAVAIQDDGKIIVAGTSDVNVSSARFAVTRLESDGTTDNAFGTNGIATIAIPDTSLADQANAVAIQDDGKIVVGGASDVNVSSGLFAVVRLETDGTPDPTFGSSGIATIAIPVTSLADRANAVTIQGDDKIVIAGTSDVNVSSARFAVVRLEIDGTPDPTFGSSGIATIAIPDLSLADRANAVAIQDDNKIVVAGASDFNVSSGLFAVVRLKSDGAPDNTFGIDGISAIAIPDLSLADQANATAIQDDDKIVVAGTSDAGNLQTSRFAAVRILGEDEDNGLSTTPGDLGGGCFIESSRLQW